MEKRDLWVGRNAPSANERAEDGLIDMQGPKKGRKKLGTGMYLDKETLHYVQETWHRHALQQACTMGQRILA